MLLLLCEGCNMRVPRPVPGERATPADSVSTALWADIDLSTFQPLPNPFDVAEMSPGVPAQSWEFRRYYPNADSSEVILERHTAGTACAGAINRARCLEAFAAAVSRAGFLPECLPGICHTYLVSTQSDEVHVWDTEEAALSFLRPVDTAAEAAFVARLNDYFGHGEKNKADGAIRADSHGYLLLVTRVDSTCPLRRTRFLIRITPAGDLLPLRRQLVEYDGESCIFI